MSVPAFHSALEVLTANDVETMIAGDVLEQSGPTLRSGNMLLNGGALARASVFGDKVSN